MKKLLILIFSFCFFAAMGQNLIAPITITLPPNPPANTADWATAMPPVMIMAQGKLQNGQLPWQVSEGTVLVTIKSAGTKICGSHTQQNAPSSNFNSTNKTWSGPSVLSLLGQDCILKPGMYELCVQFYYRNPATNAAGLAGEACKTFTIADTKQQTYSPPQNILPADGKVFSEQEANMPLTFRWTPVLPKPQGDVLYKVRVREWLPGRPKAEAIKTNPPVDVFEVKNSSQISAKLSQRCNDCFYVWDVQAEKAERGQGDKPLNYGNSEATSFSIKAAAANPEKFNSPVNQSPVDGKVFTGKDAAQPVLLKWSPVIPKPKEDVQYKVRVLEIRKGQSRAEAVKTNTPVEVLEVKNETQVISKLSKRCNGCEYLWDVTAIGTEKLQGGQPKNYGTSKATQFSVSNGSNVNVKNDSVFCKGNNNSYVFEFTILNNDNYVRTFNSLSVYSINGVVQGTAPNYMPVPAAQLTPGLGSSINANGSLYVYGSINYPGIINTITFLGQTTGGIPPKKGDFDFTDTLHCGCQTCDSVKIELGQPTLNQQNSDVNILQPITTKTWPANTPLKIKSLTAEIIYLDIIKDAPECYQCEKNSDHLGKFLSGGIMPNIMMITNSLPADELVYNAVTPQALSNTVFGFVITLPDLNRCCKDTVNICIRYTIVTEDCKSCSVTQCYIMQRSK